MTSVARRPGWPNWPGPAALAEAPPRRRRRAAWGPARGREDRSAMSARGWVSGTPQGRAREWRHAAAVEAEAAARRRRRTWGATAGRPADAAAAAKPVASLAPRTAPTDPADAKPMWPLMGIIVGVAPLAAGRGSRGRESGTKLGPRRPIPRRGQQRGRGEKWRESSASPAGHDVKLPRHLAGARIYPPLRLALSAALSPPVTPSAAEGLSGRARSAKVHCSVPPSGT